METLYDLLTDLPPGAAVVTSRTTYDADATRGTAYKAGNFLRTLGVREGVGVGVRSLVDAKPLFAFLGAALLGATVRFDPTDGDDLRAYVAPTADVEALALPPGGQRVAWGEPPETRRIEYFERDVWSENPAFPPVTFDGDTPLLVAGETAYSHRDLLDAADRFAADRFAAERPEALVVTDSLGAPGTLVAVLAALRSGEHVSLDTDVDADGAAARVGTGANADIDPRNVEI